MRKRTELENGVSSNEESIDNLDKQLSESKITLTDSENKFDDISRKLATLEADGDTSCLAYLKVNSSRYI